MDEKLKEIQAKRRARAGDGQRKFGALEDKDEEFTNEVVEVEDDDQEEEEQGRRKLVGQYTADQRFVDEALDANTDETDPMEDRRKKRTIYERESEYQRRRFARMERANETEEARMERNDVEREERRINNMIEQKQRDAQVAGVAEDEGDKTPPPPGDKTPPPPGRETTPPLAEEQPPRKRRRRWDVAPPETTVAIKEMTAKAAPQQVEKTEEKVVTQMTFEEINVLLPTDGYKVVNPPDWYKPARNQNNQQASSNNGYALPEDNSSLGRSMVKNLPTEIPGAGELNFFKESDMKYFAKLLDGQDEYQLTTQEAKERKIMRLLLKIKNGVPAVRKAAMRVITDDARYLGAQPLFDQILPLLMERDLEDQERHLLVKVIHRILFRLRDLVRPFTHKILLVIQPMLIDEDYVTRNEGREIISNLAKAVGLAQMITTLRPDIDSPDEYVRNTTARAFAVVAGALGIQNVVDFIRAVCRSRKSSDARHTGAKIVQQIAILIGSGVLPHLPRLVDAVQPLLNDEVMNVKTMCANALAALAEVSYPYGIESFYEILGPLVKGVERNRGRNLTAYLKCVGYLIPLMDEGDAYELTRRIMPVLKRNFSTPDEEMRRVVLKVVQQCAATRGVTPQYLRDEVLPSFFKSFWTVRIARDSRSYKLVVATTLEISDKVGVAEVVERIVDILRHENHVFRRMAVETVDKVINELGAVDISERLEERLIDGLLTAMKLQDDNNVDIVLLNAFGTVVNALGLRTKQYIPQIVSTILFRLGNQSDVVREQAADLITKIATTMKNCGEDALMGKLGSVLYEQLGEEYPNTLGSILAALNSIVTVVGLSSMQPPIRDLLPRLTPILRNRHEKVQENAIDLVGRIADRGADMISPKEWMRICHELLEMLRAQRKSIRKAANRTFGYIANAIGPQDVLAALLTGLRVQERQLRVCIAVAIGIVAETCAPFTVLPAVMNEYRVPEKNVQNGVLKSLTFMFEYIGDMAKDYVYAIAPLIEDALMDRDHVHRQTAATVVKHIALCTVGLGLEDVMIHFLNMLLPNIFETSPHLINRVIDGVDGLRNAVGTGVVLSYTWAGLFHPARKVRTPYWRIYNNAYIQQAHAMVPYYPDLEEPEYKRHELDIWI